MDKYIVDNTLEQSILQRLRDNHIYYELVAKRYSGNDEYHNYYNIGMSDKAIFGNIDFTENPIWRISWYKDGKTYYDTGFVLVNFDKLLDEIITKCIPRI